jgi:hypothetical protein
MPDLLLSAAEREQVSSILLPATEKAGQFAKNPPRPGPDPDPPKRGQARDTGSHRFLFNLETVLLDEFLLPITREKRRWKLLLDLLRHFNPKNFTYFSLHAIRNHAQWFREEHPEILKDHKQRYLARMRHLMGRRPV